MSVMTDDDIKALADEPSAPVRNVTDDSDIKALADEPSSSTPDADIKALADEGADTGSVWGDIGGAIYDIPVHSKAAIARLLEGSDPYGERNILDEWIAESEKRQKERDMQPGGDESFLGISRKNIRNFPSNAAFSGVSMLSGLGAGITSGVATANPAVGWAAGGAASGISAYRMDVNQFLRTVRSAMDEEAMVHLGRPITDEEWKQKEPELMDAAKRHGLYEAIPEAVGNVAGLKIITKPLMGVLGKNVATRVLAKLGGLYGVEMTTEATTQMGQHNVERDVGLTTEPEREWTSGKDWMESLKEIAPDTFLLTTVFGLGGMAANKGYQAIKGEKPATQFYKDAVKEGKLNLIPDSEYSRVLEHAEELAAEHQDDKDMQDAVEAMRQESERRKQDPERKEDVKPMEPQAEPQMEEDTPEHTPEFLNWFGESKVTDNDGKPMVVYHGSPVKGFDTFDLSKVNPNDPDAPYNGFWFSGSFEDARTSGDYPWGRPNTPGGGETRAFYLSLKNPATRAQAKQIARETNSTGAKLREELQRRGYDGVIHSPPINITQEQRARIESGEMVNVGRGMSLKAEEGYISLYEGGQHITGYGSIDEFMNQVGHGTYVAFRPEQIKSATDNTGSFDPNNPNVFYQKDAMQPGSRHRGDITDTESAQRSQDPNVDDTLFRGKDAVVRREKIISKLAKAIGYPVYQGRIGKKSKYRGYYMHKTDEVRIQKHNDIEVAAHEIAHLIDYKDKLGRGHSIFSKAYQSPEFKEEVRALSYDKKKIYEGFAEFVRLWMTDRAYVQQHAPKFTAWFEKTLETYEHGKAIKEAAAEMHAWFNQGHLKRFESKTGVAPETLKETIKRKTDKWYDRLIAATFDAFHGVKLMTQDLTPKDAKALPAYMAVRLLAGNRMITRSIFEHGTVNFRDNGDLYFTGGSLDDVFKDVSDDMKGTLHYFAARRARELYAQGREHHYTEGEFTAYIEESEKNFPKRKEAFEKWLGFNQRMLDFMQASGVLSAESRANFDRMNREYVPFRRVIEGVTKQPVFNTADVASVFRRLTGGTSNVNDILENITVNTQLMVEAAMANRAKQEIYNLVGSKKGGAKYAVKIAPIVKPAKVDKQQLIQLMQDSNIHVTEEQVEKMDDFVTFFTYGHPPKGNVDVVYYQGKPTYFELNPDNKLFMDAIAAFGPKNFGLAMRLISGSKNLLTRMVTLSPEFIAVNFIRDTTHSSLTSKHGFIPLVDSIRGFKSRMSEDSAYWEAMVNGMGMASMLHGETARYQHRLERIYTKNGVSWQSVIDTPGKLADMWEDIASYSEYSARVQEFKKARKAGVSAREAAFAGRELATDFSMRGSSNFVRLFTMSVPFLGAHIQSLYRGARAIAPGLTGATKERESFKRLAVKGLVGITIPTLYLYMLNRDDDKYKGLRDWERMLHWVIRTDDGKNVYLIPKPFDFGALFATIPELMTERYIRELEGSNKGDGEKFAKALTWVLANQFGINFTPQLIKGPLDLMLNKQWTGGPIITKELENVKASEQFTPWTSQTMIELGKKVNMSPAKMEYLLRSYFGTLGGYALMASDNLVERYTGNRSAESRLDETIGIRRFVRETPLRHTSWQDRFYEMNNEITEVLNTFEKIKKDMRPEDARDYLSTEREQRLYGMGQVSKSVQSAARDIRSAIRFIRNNPKYSPEEKRKLINDMLKQQSDLFRTALPRMEEALYQ